MLKQSRTIPASLLGIITILLSSGAQAVTYPYLEDADPVAVPAPPAGAPSIQNHLWPRTMLGDSYIELGNRENRYSKYNILATQATVMKAVARIQSNYPDLMYFRMYTPRETQEFQNTVYCSQKGLPFEGTAAATSGCNVYAGHWLYRAGSKTTAWTTPTATEVSVSDTSKYTVGRYVVIYDSPVASFKNAEHAEIVSINNATGKISVQRGYKSTPVAHPKGAIVAQHVLGQAGNNPENWAYNLSSQSPIDANGNQLGDYSALFLKNNLKKSWKGENININVSGVMFDVDYHFELKSKLADVNNDLITDHGISPTGVNWYGEGMDSFYSKVRSYFPDLYIVGGTSRARGDGILSGIQFEGWLTGFEGTGVDYGKIDSQISNYTYFSHNQSSPIHSNGLMKQGTAIYPIDGKSNPNSIFRLALGAILLEDGYFGQQTTKQIPDTWYDEFSVDVEANSPTYGQAIVSNPYDESATRKHRGWLGKPLGPRRRIYGNQFAASKSLISNGTFDTDINGWTGNNVNISRATGTKMDGSGALRVSKHTTYQSNVWDAVIKGSNVTLVSGKQYTLVFSAKAPVLREVTAKVGTKSQSFLVGPNWRRYVMTFKEGNGGSQKVQFQVGRENTKVYLDTVHLFTGNANIFRRDFEKGIVIVNATRASKTVSLGSVFQKIQGNQDPSINDGSSISSVTLAKMDAILLVRPDGQAVSHAKPPAGDECGVPSGDPGTEKGAFLWKDCGTTDTWHLRVTAGGSTVVKYKGNITSTDPISATESSIESSDSVDTSNSRNISYKMNVIGYGVDGIDFNVSNAGGCLSPTEPSGGILYIGPSKIPVSTSLNLLSLGSCQ